MRQYKNVLTGPKTPFAIVEAYKEIRTNMLYTARGLKCPIYALTSAQAHAGKSVTSANLASSFAELGKRVLLIDADLRNPVQDKIFSLNRSAGVSEIAAGLREGLEAVAVKTHIEGLDLVPAGHIPPNPSELLSSAHFEAFLRTAQESYDAIFIDFPPAGVVVDALIPAHLITGYAVVVRSGLDDRRAVSALLDSLNGVGAKVIGFIMNGIDPKVGRMYEGSRAYKYRSDYSYGDKVQKRV